MVPITRWLLSLKLREEVKLKVNFWCHQMGCKLRESSQDRPRKAYRMWRGEKSRVKGRTLGNTSIGRALKKTKEQKEVNEKF